MNPDQMKDAVRRCMLEGFSTGNIDFVDQFIHEDYVRTSTAGHPSVRSLAEHKKELAQRREIFADLKIEIIEMVAEKDTVAVRFATSGVHKKEYLGVAPTGKRINRESCGFFHFRDGKIANTFVITDVFGTLEQLKK